MRGGRGDEESRHSLAIDKGLKEDQNTRGATFKVLVAGRDGRMKRRLATLLKRFKSDPIVSEAEKKTQVDFVRWGLFCALQTLMCGMDEMKKQPLSPELSVVCDVFRRNKNKTQNAIVEMMSFSEKIVSLWNDPAFQSVWKASPMFEIEQDRRDGLFFNDLKRFFDVSYVATDDDIMYVATHIPYHGVRETVVPVKKYHKVVFVEFFEEEGEKKQKNPHDQRLSKWMQCFQDEIECVFFVVSLSDYDLFKTDEEGEEKNLLLESLSLFSRLINSVTFSTTDILLIFDQKDLFCHKLSRTPLTVCFKEGFPSHLDARDYDYALQFIVDKFKSVDMTTEVEHQTTRRSIYVHTVCATDSKSIMLAFDCIQDIAIKKYLISI